jgi:serine/threonine protein kinase
MIGKTISHKSSKNSLRQSSSWCTETRIAVSKTISHYKILEKLGAGGMGVVYKAEDTRLKRTVALKFLPPHLTRDEEAKARFTTEAQAASALDHQNICTIHRIDETDDGQMYIVMAYYEGETLLEKVSSGQFSVDSAVDSASQIADAIATSWRRGLLPELLVRRRRLGIPGPHTA